MSNIWHTAKESPERLKLYVENYKGRYIKDGYIINQRYGNCNRFFDSTTIRWCYLDDLLALEAELERTRKALDVAVDALKSAQQYICSDKKSYQIIQTAIEQITALEQKDKK